MRLVDEPKSGAIRWNYFIPPALSASRDIPPANHKIPIDPDFFYSSPKEMHAAFDCQDDNDMLIKACIEQRKRI
jgi:hypothetical protein